MKVKLLTTLGSRDAGQLGLDAAKCGIGETVEVSDDGAKYLMGNGWCEVSEVKAVAPKPKIAKAKTPKGMVRDMEAATPKEMKNNE